MLEDKIYRIILITSCTLSIFSIAGNVLAGFAPIISLKWIVLFLISGLAIYFQRKKRVEWWKFAYFIFLIVAFLPFAFFDSGGSENNAIAYVFLVLICVAYLFEGKQRMTLIVLLLVMFPALIAVEFYYPEAVKTHPPITQFIDRMIQIPLIMTGAYVLVSRFANAYEAQKKHEASYSRRLEILNAKLEFQAYHDTLTRLKNRRAFDLALKQIKTSGTESVYVVIFDIDKFKQINDTLGHLAGDEILAAFSKKLLGLCSDTVLISRWGGDEFGMIINQEKNEVLDLLSGVQQDYADVVKPLGVTTHLSFGVAMWKSGLSEDEILTRADNALYKAKQTGRGKMVFAPCQTGS